LSLLFAVIIAAIRQKLHLSRCPDLPSQLWRQTMTAPTPTYDYVAHPLANMFPMIEGQEFEP
jgi:hypothetical protein